MTATHWGEVTEPIPGSQWPKTALRVGFGVIWLIDAVLKWLPGFRADYMSTIMGEADGQPGWTKPWFDFWTSLQHPFTTFFAYFVAVIETLIALALIMGFARKITYIGAITFSLLIWGTAEGFGGPYTSGASDIGTAIIYVLVFVALLGFAYYHGTSRLSVDHYLEKRISWWHWVAEVGRRNHPHHRTPAHGHRPPRTRTSPVNNVAAGSPDGS
jgi:nitrite reductase (NO-forming)